MITQYFWPIVSGDLAVEIVAGDATRRIIDAETISREVHNCGTASADTGEEAAGPMARAIELAAWGTRVSEDACVEATGRHGKNAISSRDLDSVRERYERGDRLVFDVRTKVGGVLSRFRVFMEKDDTLSKGHDYYVRGHLHIPGMDYLHTVQARALTFVDNRTPLGHLLRDSEGPAHDKWNASAQRLKEKRWPAGAERVREAQRAAERILHQLAEKREEKQRDALADLFPSRRKKSEARSVPSNAPGGREAPDDPAAKPALQVRQVGTGFVATTESDDGLIGTTWTVRTAYDVARGTVRTALTRFGRGAKAGCPDFSFRDDGMSVECEGCAVEVVADNELRVLVTEPAMSLRVTGFDDRDLLVDASPVATTEDGDEA